MSDENPEFPETSLSPEDEALARSFSVALDGALDGIVVNCGVDPAVDTDGTPLEGYTLTVLAFDIRPATPQTQVKLSGWIKDIKDLNELRAMHQEMSTDAIAAVKIMLGH